MFRKLRAKRLVKRHYWEGFFARMGGGIGPDMPLEYSGMPHWYNEVAEIGYRAGYLRAEQAITVDSNKRFGTMMDRHIPASVYAEAYGAL